MENLDRPVFRQIRRDLRKSRHEAGVPYELRGDAMIGMPSLERGADDHPRLQSPDDPGELLARLGRVGDAGVGEKQVLADDGAGLGSALGAARIELSDLKERIRKLEAIASGVDL